MKYFVFLMLAVCVGCSGQGNRSTVPEIQHFADEHGVFHDEYGNIIGLNCFSISGATSCDGSNPLIPHQSTDRFANCVTSNGIHYCPEGRYVQVPEDANPSISIACPVNELCSTTASPFAGNTICGSGWDCGTFIGPSNPTNGDDNSHLDLNSCSVDATGSFNCPPVAPTTKKAPKAPSCSLWFILDGDDADVYCGDHSASDAEISGNTNWADLKMYHNGDKGIPKHKSSETKSKVREFYPPDPDKGPQILKANLGRMFK